MTAALAQTPILRTASGEPPLGRDAAFFLDDQGEIFEHDNPRYRSSNMRIAVLELDSGEWLALPPSFHVNRPRYPNREAALRAAIGAMIRRARKYMRTKEGEGTQWSEGLGCRIIEWALQLKPLRATGEPPEYEGLGNAEPDPVREAGFDGGSPVASSIPDDWASTITDKMIAEELTIAGYAASDAGAGLSDPVVSYLVKQHELRRQFPAKHIFAMTTEVAEGRIVTVATCACKQVFRFGSNDHLRMNAAIEAHWRRFAHEKTVDGMGHPINAEPAKKPRKRKSSNGGVESGHAGKVGSPVGLTQTRPDQAGVAPGPSETEPGARGQSPAPIASAPSTWTTAGADASLADAKCGACQPAPIGASTEEYLAGITARTRRLDDLGSVQDGLKMSTDGHPAGGGSTSASERQLTRVTGGESAATLSDDDDFWDSPLIKMAVQLAWREEPFEPDPVQEFEQMLPPLMGPEERRRKVTEFKLALKQKPVNLGPLFGEVPPPSTTAT